VTFAAPHNTITVSTKLAELYRYRPMLEQTQEVLGKIDPFLDAGDTASAGRLLVSVGQTSLRAVLIHILRERGGEVADAVGAAYLRAHAASRQESKAA